MSYGFLNSTQSKVQYILQELTLVCQYKYVDQNYQFIEISFIFFNANISIFSAKISSVIKTLLLKIYLCHVHMWLHWFLVSRYLMTSQSAISELLTKANQYLKRLIDKLSKTNSDLNTHNNILHSLFVAKCTNIVKAA